MKLKILSLMAGALALVASPAVAQSGSTAWQPKQTVVGTTAVKAVDARPGRRQVLLSVGAPVACAFGNAGVTLTTGFPLQAVAGATLLANFSGEVYVVCASAATTVSSLELF